MCPHPASLNCSDPAALALLRPSPSRRVRRRCGPPEASAEPRNRPPDRCEPGNRVPHRPRCRSFDGPKDLFDRVGPRAQFGPVGGAALLGVENVLGELLVTTRDLAHVIFLLGCEL